MRPQLPRPFVSEELAHVGLDSISLNIFVPVSGMGGFFLRFGHVHLLFTVATCFTALPSRYKLQQNEERFDATFIGGHSGLTWVTTGEINGKVYPQLELNIFVYDLKNLVWIWEQ